MEKLLKVSLNDFRLIFRDNSLKFFFILPLLNILVIRYGLPFVIGQFNVLGSYVPQIEMLFSVQGAVAFGFIYSMVLIDEKDTNVAKVYGVLPVSHFWFTVFRLIPPFLLATVSTFFLFFFEPFYDFPLLEIAIYSALTALMCPLMILFVTVFSENKIEAMTWQKLFNIPLFLPVISFFVSTTFAVLFGVFPVYWAFRGLDNLINSGNAGWEFAVCFIYSIFVIYLFLKKFQQKHFY